MIISGLIIILSLAGLVNAVYFTLAYYGRVRKARWVPQVLCAREGSSCVTVVQTPYARVLGVPNSLLGLIYYFLVIGWNLSRQVQSGNGLGMLILGRVVIAASAVTVLMGFYLIYALRQKLHTDCPLCYAAHAINGTLLLLLILLL